MRADFLGWKQCTFLLGAVETVGAFVDESNLAHRRIRRRDFRNNLHMRAVVVVLRKGEDWLHAAVILYQFACHSPHHHAQTDFRMILGIDRCGEVPAKTCLQVCAAKRGGIRCGDKQIAFCGTGCGI